MSVIAELITFTIDVTSKHLASKLRRSYASQSEFPRFIVKKDQRYYVEPFVDDETKALEAVISVVLSTTVVGASWGSLFYVVKHDYDEWKKMRLERDQFWEKERQKIDRQEVERSIEDKASKAAYAAQGMGMTP